MIEETLLRGKRFDVDDFGQGSRRNRLSWRYVSVCKGHFFRTEALLIKEEDLKSRQRVFFGSLYTETYKVIVDERLSHVRLSMTICKKGPIVLCKSATFICWLLKTATFFVPCRSFFITRI